MVRRVGTRSQRICVNFPASALSLTPPSPSSRASRLEDRCAFVSMRAKSARSDAAMAQEIWGDRFLMDTRFADTASRPAQNARERIQ